MAAALLMAWVLPWNASIGEAHDRRRGIEALPGLKGAARRAQQGRERRGDKDKENDRSPSLSDDPRLDARAQGRVSAPRTRCCCCCSAGLKVAEGGAARRGEELFLGVFASLFLFRTLSLVTRASEGEARVRADRQGERREGGARPNGACACEGRGRDQGAGFCRVVLASSRAATAGGENDGRRQEGRGSGVAAEHTHISERRLSGRPSEQA